MFKFIKINKNITTILSTLFACLFIIVICPYYVVATSLIPTPLPVDVQQSDVIVIGTVGSDHSSIEVTETLKGESPSLIKVSDFLPSIFLPEKPVRIYFLRFDEKNNLFKIIRTENLLEEDRIISIVNGQNDPVKLAEQLKQIGGNLDTIESLRMRFTSCQINIPELSLSKPCPLEFFKELSWDSKTENIQVDYAPNKSQHSRYFTLHSSEKSSPLSSLLLSGLWQFLPLIKLDNSTTLTVTVSWEQPKQIASLSTKEVTKYLHGCIKSGNSEIGVAAMNTLLAMQSRDSVPTIIEAMNYTRSKVTIRSQRDYPIRNAISFLGSSQDVRAIPFLCRLIDEANIVENPQWSEDHQEIIWADDASEALAKINNPDSSECLRRGAARGFERAAQYLAKLPNSESDNSFPILLKAAQDEASKKNGSVSSQNRAMLWLVSRSNKQTEYWMEDEGTGYFSKLKVPMWRAWWANNITDFQIIKESKQVWPQTKLQPEELLDALKSNDPKQKYLALKRVYYHEGLDSLVVLEQVMKSLPDNNDEVAGQAFKSLKSFCYNNTIDNEMSRKINELISNFNVTATIIEQILRHHDDSSAYYVVLGQFLSVIRCPSIDQNQVASEITKLIEKSVRSRFNLPTDPSKNGRVLRLDEITALLHALSSFGSLAKTNAISQLEKLLLDLSPLCGQSTNIGACQFLKQIGDLHYAIGGKHVRQYYLPDAASISTPPTSQPAPKISNNILSKHIDENGVLVITSRGSPSSNVDSPRSASQKKIIYSGYFPNPNKTACMSYGAFKDLKPNPPEGPQNLSYRSNADETITFTWSCPYNFRPDTKFLNQMNSQFAIFCCDCATNDPGQHKEIVGRWNTQSETTIKVKSGYNYAWDVSCSTDTIGLSKKYYSHANVARLGKPGEVLQYRYYEPNDKEQLEAILERNRKKGEENQKKFKRLLATDEKRARRLMDQGVPVSQW